MKPGGNIAGTLLTAGIVIFGGLALSLSPKNPFPVLLFSDSEPVKTTALSEETLVFIPVNENLPDRVIVPLKRAGRLFLIDSIIDGQSGNLVFDTGAKNLVLNKTYFREYHTSTLSGTQGITGDVGESEEITLKKMEFAGMDFSNLTAETANLGHIENHRGVRILGLVGFSMFRNHEIIIDPEHDELRLYLLDRSGNRIFREDPPFVSDYRQTIQGNAPVLFLKATVGGKTLNFCFDTAAETNVISSGAGKNVLNTITVTRRTTLRGAGLSARDVLFGRMNDFTLGTRPINNMETIVTNLFSLSEVYNTSLDGILGFSFLEHGIISVNFINHQVGFHFVNKKEP